MLQAIDMGKVAKIGAFLAAFLVISMIHEGLHAATAMMYGEYNYFIIHPYGFEVVFVTPVELRAGFMWFIISGVSNIMTPLLGYVLLYFTLRFKDLRGFMGASVYWLTLLLLIADPLNLFIGPFLYGGDAVGMAIGLEVPVLVIQGVGLIVFLVNRELVATKLLPAYGVEPKHPLFVPWFIRS